MKWKFLGVWGVALGIVMTGALVQPVWAKDPEGPVKGESQEVAPVERGKSCSDNTFLFFKPWYAGICTSEGKSTEIVPVCEKDKAECPENSVSLATFVWTIVLNVLFDLTLVIGYLAMVMMVYGGYQYIMSQGDPAKMAKGKKTLVTAVTGVVLGLSASILVNVIIGILGINREAGIHQGTDWTAERVDGIFNYAYAMAGIIAVVFIIKGGIDYMLSAGDPAKASKATRSLIYAVVGLVIVILAAVITNFIVSSVSGAL